MRWFLRLIVIYAFAASLVAGGLMGPSSAAAHSGAESAQADTHHAASAASHHPSPDHSQDGASMDDGCCMLACTPVVLAVSSPVRLHLRAAECLAPALVQAMAPQRSEPPFHPPRHA